MDTDPNPFRDTPDSDRSSSPSEAEDNSTRDFTLDNDTSTTGGHSPMSDDEGNEDATSGTADTSDSAINSSSTEAETATNATESGTSGASQSV